MAGDFKLGSYEPHEVLAIGKRFIFRQDIQILPASLSHSNRDFS